MRPRSGCPVKMLILRRLKAYSLSASDHLRVISLLVHANDDQPASILVIFLVLQQRVGAFLRVWIGQKQKTKVGRWQMR
jgi:hypothetical protein